MVPYTRYLHTPSFFNFFRLLTRWRGGFYKLVALQCFIFFFIYFFILACYSFLLPESARRTFESVLSMLARNRGELGSAVAFFLGFFIDQVYCRFWRQVLTIPWPDGFAFMVSVDLIGCDKRSRVIRRTLVRYVCTAVIMGMGQVAPSISERFPTIQSYVSSELLTPNEAEILEGMDCGDFNKYHILLSWACALLRRAREEDRIHDDHSYNSIYLEIDKIRGQLALLGAYNIIPVPLVYIQVVVIAVYSFFAVVVFTHPFEKWEFTSGHVFSVEESYSYESELDRATRLRMRFMFIVITFVQFLVFAGILHSSEVLITPFGKNDNDIDVNHLIDRHLGVCYLIVDEMYSVIPEMVDDQFWANSCDEVDYKLKERSTHSHKNIFMRIF